MDIPPEYIYTIISISDKLIIPEEVVINKIYFLQEQKVMLDSERAIKVNIQIIRLVTRIPELILTHKEALLKLEQMEKNILQNSEDLKIVFTALK